MATIKSYTDLEQSKKLAEILPIESADRYYNYNVGINSYYEDVPRVIQVNNHFAFFHRDVPCWSLAALLGVLPKEIVYNKGIVYLELHVWDNSLEYVNNADYTLHITRSYDNLIDACVEMIEKLHELKML